VSAAGAGTGGARAAGAGGGAGGGREEGPAPARRSFFWRLFRSYTALVLLCAGVIGVLVLGNARQNALRDAEADLLNMALLMSSLEAANPSHLWSPQLGRQLAEVERDTGLSVGLYFANGREAGPGGPPGAEGEAAARLALPEFAGTFTASHGRAVRADEAGAEHLWLVTPILLETDRIGYVRLGAPLARIAAREAELRDRVLAGTSISVAVALGLGFFFTRAVTRPLREIGESCRRLAAGDLDERIRLKDTDEIGVVAATINRMAEEVRRRIHEERRERQRLAALLAAMADGVVAVNARGGISYANRVAVDLLGLPEAPRGLVFAQAVMLGPVREAREEALAAGRRVVRGARLLEGSATVVLRIDATPLRDDAGAPFGVLLVLHDLTELRRLEEARRTFTANASHELKTPLTAICSLVDTVLEDPEMKEETRRRFLGRVRAQSERLQELVQDLLAISRLESEHEAPAMERVDMAAVAVECAQTLADVADRKGVKLTWGGAEGELPVRGNVESLRMVFNNLLKNAVAYTEPGGRVEMEFEAGEDSCAVRVRDTGVGMAPEHVARIFERFYRVDRSRSREGGGTGLGLSIVKHLVQVMGGRVTVRSELGEGSVFTVRFARDGGN
jgi:two-component system phosphate regulon sensor histidine kinase PhoR